VFSADIDGRAVEVGHPVAVVVVKMSQHNGFEILRCQATLGEPGTDALVGWDVDVDGEKEERLPLREVAGVRGSWALAGVDQDNPLWVLDEVGVDRQRRGPTTVGEHPQPAQRHGPIDGLGAVAWPDSDGAGLKDTYGDAHDWLRCVS
jgi:hypothetical protein